MAGGFPPELTSPIDGATGVVARPTFTWDMFSESNGFTIQVARDNGFSQLIIDDPMVDGFATSYTPNSDLPAGTLLYWRMNTYIGGQGDSDWSSVSSFTTIQVIPDIPDLSSPTNDATGISTTPTLSWSSAARATSYDVQVSTDVNFGTTIIDQASIVATQYVISSALSTLTYYWRVRSRDNSNNLSSWTSPYSFSTIPIAPSGFTSPIDYGAETRPCTFTWTAVAGITKYQLQLSVPLYHNTFDQLEFDVEVNTNTYSATLVGNANGVSPTYGVRVRSVTSSNVTSEWTTYQFDGLTRILIPFTPGNNQTGVAVRPTFEWQRVRLNLECHHYHMQVSKFEDFHTIYYEQDNILPTNDASETFTIPVDLIGTRFYWRVRKFVEYVNAFDPWSRVNTFTIVQSSIGVPTLSLKSKTGLPITFEWSSVPGDVTYVLQVAQEKEFSHLSVHQSILATNSYTTTEGLNRQTYYWRVKAKQGELAGDWSDVASFIVVPSVNKERVELVKKAIIARRKGNPHNYGWPKLGIKFKGK